MVAYMRLGSCAVNATRHACVFHQNLLSQTWPHHASFCVSPCQLRLRSLFETRKAWALADLEPYLRSAF
jgi:hypothetical protein